MAAILTKANRLIFDRKNTLVIDGKHGWGVAWCGQAKDLEAALDAYAGEVVSVTFKTYSDDTAAGDVATYKRRLDKLSPRYAFGGFQKQVIDGYVMDHIYVGVINRVA